MSAPHLFLLETKLSLKSFCFPIPMSLSCDNEFLAHVLICLSLFRSYSLVIPVFTIFRDLPSSEFIISSPNPLLAHLDAQLSELRAEISTLYRTQAASQNKQLSLSDALRDRDEEVRGLREDIRELREARDGLQRREKDWDERWKMRTKDMEVCCILILDSRYAR